MPEIRVDHLTKAFGPTTALDDMSFVVRDKEFLTLLGPSGCGKSTTLMAIAGFQRPDHGSIRVGDDVFFDDATRVDRSAETRNVGVVFQSYAIWPHMTVFHNVAFPLTTRRWKKPAIRERVLDILDLVELTDHTDRYPHQLSGGQQQRVAIARALSGSPSVLLLDEPFSNLDAKLRARARGWLKGLQQQLGFTAIFVTHDQDEALSMSDRILVLDGGRILQAGRPEDVYRRPANRFVADFVGHCNFLTGTVTANDGARLCLRVDGTPYHLVVETTARHSIGSAVTIAVRPEAIQLTSAPESDGPNVWPVSVRSSSFLGDHYEHDAELCSLALTVQTTLPVTRSTQWAHLPPTECAILDPTYTTVQSDSPVDDESAFA
jgi:iron(III) transport system ATP-binding protein